MIARTWKAHTTPDKEAAYLQTVRQVVLPQLRAKEGFAGAQFMRRQHRDGVEIMVVTFWSSMADAEALSAGSAGSFVPEEIAATLERYDHDVQFFEVAIDEKVRGEIAGTGEI